MSEGWKPEGYPSVSVYIVTHDAQKVIDLLKKAFEATQLRRMELLMAKSCTLKYALAIV
jgi:uncharacterized glyoxalase superfamily protein PhnB